MQDVLPILLDVSSVFTSETLTKECQTYFSRCDRGIVCS